MTPTFALSRARSPRLRWRAEPRNRPIPVSRGANVPPLSPSLQLLRATLVLVFVLSLTLLTQLVVVSSLQHSAAQGRSLDSFRSELAKGTAPIGPTDSEGNQLQLGTPVAYIEIPSIGVREVVGEGTTSGVLFDGPGHRRDSPLPGQVGTSVVFGRRAAFGGPFSSIGELTEGDAVTVTTGQGVFTFKVTGVRPEGAPVPPAPSADAARLLLVTAAGRPFLPGGVLRVDAELDGVAVIGPARLISASALPAAERIMGGDARTLWALALWLQALIALSLGVVWAWHRWGRAQAWVVFLPPLVLVGLATSGEAARILPNLL
ncbi:MAG: class E sortase [Actinomycetota bacterium]|nr:MAG: sortase [Acidimicrobiaceae bacterium]